MVNALAKSGAKVGPLKLKGAQAPHRERFFYACVMVGCVGALSGAPLPLGGRTNPAWPIALRLVPGGDGVSPLPKEASTMADKTPLQADYDAQTLLLGQVRSVLDILSWDDAFVHNKKDTTAYCLGLISERLEELQRRIDRSYGFEGDSHA